MADTTTATAATPAAPAAPAFDPKGKNFLQRLDAFIADVKSTYKLTITRDSGRTVAWEQKMHICHMFLYNKFETTTPKNVDPAGRTIAWSHLSDAKVIWATVPFTEILRTSKDGLPTKDAKTATGWQKDLEPDKDATEKQAKSSWSMRKSETVVKRWLPPDSNLAASLVAVERADRSTLRTWRPICAIWTR